MKMNFAKFLEVLTLFQKVSKCSGEQYVALCPAHDDKNPSLSLAYKDGRFLLYCHAGCDYRDVLAAVGLNRRGQHE
jgi:DNA primase